MAANKNNSVTLYIDGQPVSTEPVIPFSGIVSTIKVGSDKEFIASTTPLAKPNNFIIAMQYYMRRGNNRYFKLVDGTDRRLIADVDPKDDQYKHLKYGDIIKANIVFDEGE